MSLLPLATEVLKLINTAQARKYLDELVGLEKDLLTEQAKGFDSDDEKIVQIYKKMKIVADATHQEWLTHAAASSTS